MLFVIGANAQIGAFNIVAACSSSCNGSVELRPLIPLDGPLTLEITNVGGDFRKLDIINAAVLVDHLCTGQYTVAIYKKGIQACVNSLSFTVPTEDNDFEITTAVEHIPVGQTVGGSIRAIATPSGKYNYTWNTGKEDIGSERGSQITNLVPGWYRIDVQKISRCGSRGKDVSVLIEACDNSFPLGVIVKTLKNPSLNTADGEIKIVLQQACKQYQIQWMNNQTQQIVSSNSTQGNCEISSSIVGLNPGVYTLMITDTENGCQLAKEYELTSCGVETGFPTSIIKDFELKIEHEIDELNNQIKARTLIRYVDDANGFIPLPDFFTIYWTNLNGSYENYSREFETFYDLGLNVSAIVSNGCFSHRADLRINNGGFKLDIKQACVSAEGEEYREGEVAVTYKTNASSAPSDIELKLLGDKIPNGEILIPFARTDNGNITTLIARLKLRMGNYKIVAVSNNSILSEELFTVSSTRKSGGVFSYESDLVCYYNNPHCGTAADILTRLPAMVIPLDMSSSTAEMCAADIKCGETVVKTISESPKELINQEYWNLLWSLRGSPNYDWDYVYDRIQAARGKKACTKLTFCPLSLKAIYHNAPERGAAEVTDDGRCRTYKCRTGVLGLGRENITICDENWGNNVLDALGGIDFRCERVTYYISDLIHWYKQGWFASNSVFLGSSLGEFIAANQTRESEFLCSTVSFCKKNYSEPLYDRNECGTGSALVFGPDKNAYIGPDGEYVITATRIPVNNCYPHWSDPGRFCIKNGKGFYVPYQNNNRPLFAPESEAELLDAAQVVNFDGSIEPLDTLSSALKAIKVNQPNESLLNFARLTSDSIVVPKGMVQTERGMYFYEYGDGHNEVMKERIGKIKHYVSNWDNDYLSTVEELNRHTRYLVTTQRDSLRWNNELKSDQFVTVDYFTQEDTVLTISGQFSGQLTLNNNPMKQVFSPTIGVYIMQTSTKGNLISTKYIVGVDSSASGKYSESQKGSMLLAVKSVSDIMEVENSNLNLGSNNRTVVLKHNGASPMQVLQKFSLPSQARVAALGWNSSATECAVLISGVDTLALFNQEAIGTGGSRLALQRFDQNGVAKRSNYWKPKDVKAGNYSMVYGQGNELFVGMTFKDTLQLAQLRIKSRGNTDIALLKLDQLGTQKWAKQYGTIDQENISQLMYSNGNVFFGGEFDGATKVRTIGMYDFVNAGAFSKNVYISYVPDSIQVQPTITTPEILIAASKKLIKQEGKIQVKIYPNPFQNEISLQVDSDRSFPLTATLFNEIGRSVMTFNWNAVVGENQYTIQTSQLSSGFYFLQMRDNQGKLVQIHKIVKL